MAQRVTSQAVVLPTSQVSPGQPEVATVQPTVSVSPSVSSGAGPSQLPSTLQPPQPVPLEAGALEFYPRSSEVVVLELEDTAMPLPLPRAVVIHRQNQQQASTSGLLAAPGGPCTSGAPQGGASAPTTSSVPPTLQRPREQVADSDSQSSNEGGVAARGAVPGMQKKARTISSTEGLQVAVSRKGEGEEGISGSGVMESDSSNQLEGGEERREVVGTSGKVATCSVVTTSTQEKEEEVLVNEQDEAEEDMEVSEDMEEGEGPDDLEPDNLEDEMGSEVDQGQEVEIEIDDVAAVTSDEEREVGGGQEEAGMVDENSIEASINTEVGEEQRVLQKCKKCFSNFTTISALNEHARTPGLCERKKSKRDSLSCPRCSKNFSRRSVWSHHVTYSLECQAKKVKQMRIPQTDHGAEGGGEGTPGHGDVIMESEEQMIPEVAVGLDHCYSLLTPDSPGAHTQPPVSLTSNHSARSTPAPPPTPVHRDYVSALFHYFVPNMLQSQAPQCPLCGQQDVILTSHLNTCPVGASPSVPVFPGTLGQGSGSGGREESRDVVSGKEGEYQEENGQESGQEGNSNQITSPVKVRAILDSA